MRLITLNIWGGRVTKPFLDFLGANADTDIFCFQEVYNGMTKPVVEDKGDQFDIYTDIQKVLLGHVGYFRPSIPGYGLAIFVKDNITVDAEGDAFIYQVSNYVSGGNHDRNLQYVQFGLSGKKTAVVSVHGLWNGMGKTDTEERLEQSRKIKKFVDSTEGKAVLCGDFNLNPETKSVRILEEGMHNLVKEYGVTSTRTSLYGKSEKFADYIFTSPEVEIIDFKVLPDEVSDHSPLFLEFR